MNEILSKLTNKAKTFINSIRIPPLLSFFISKDGKIDPTLDETLKDAPPANQNWIRIGLQKQVFGPIQVWMILVLPIAMWVFGKGSDALKFFIDFATNAVMVAPLAGILYFIWKSYKKK